MAAPACPRCAYDLSGIAETWTDHCPLEGTCSECGLNLQWVDAYFPDRERVRGLIEHSRGLLQSAWWSFRTLWLVARPWTFWRRVTMAMTPRLKRIVLWLLLLTTALWCAGALMSNGMFLWLQRAAPGARIPPTEVGLLNGWTQPLAAQYEVPAWIMPPRATAYDWARGTAPLGVMSERGYSGSSIDLGAVALAVIIAAAAWPAVFLVLGDTRRLGKLRRDHLLRATWYSLSFLLFLALLRIVHLLGWANWMVTALARSRLSYYADPWWILGRGVPHDLWIGALVLAWVQAWWLAAIVLGFRLRSGVALWLLLATISALVGVLSWMFLAGANGALRTL